MRPSEPPSSGPVGTSVSITGTAFIGATEVDFNGTAASFDVPSYSKISATVPAGAYRLDAESNHGRTEVSGLQRSADAAYEVQALSDSGNVTVRGGG